MLILTFTNLSPTFQKKERKTKKENLTNNNKTSLPTGQIGYVVFRYINLYMIS